MTSIQSQNNITTQQKRTDKVSLPKLALGLVGGAATGFAANTATGLLMHPLVRSYQKNADKFYASDNNVLISEANRMIDESGIAKRGFKDITLVHIPMFSFPVKDMPNSGVKTIDIIRRIIKRPDAIKSNPDNQNIREYQFVNQDKISVNDACQKFYKDYLDSVGNGSLGTKGIALYETITDPLKYSNILIGKIEPVKLKMKSAVTNGVFVPTSNNIISGSPNSLLHEVGHAINRNKNFMTRLPQSLSAVSIKLLTPLVILNAIFTKRQKSHEENSDQKKSLFAKTREFTRNHLGLTIAGLWVPTLIEEAVATLRALDFAKKSENIGDKLRHQHKKCLKMAFGTYLVAAISSVFSIKLAVLVKDKIIEHKTKNK